MTYAADRCRILENGPASSDDYEIARDLIDQGLADGRYGPPSKSRDHFGKTTQLVWFGITPAGRLWLEQIQQGSSNGLGQASESDVPPQTEGGSQDRGAQKPPSSLVNQAWTVAGGVVLALIVYLLRTHLGIPL